MNLLELVTKNRSHRRFQQSEPISMEQLRSLVELARLSPTAGNLQPLKFILSNDAARNETIFSCLVWESYIKNSPGPGEGRRPAGYIVILGDTSITTDFSFNHGIAAQSILLGATEMGFGGYMFAHIERDRLASLIGIPDRYEILAVVALGVPRERAVVTEAKNGDVAYWRDINKVHHVPKRALSEIILEL
ncbi:MAG TPA: nitroreductase [Deltaproteobacteria bacterium]|nr:nitroreductase [Deltaproteobacteria bacterium]